MKTKIDDGLIVRLLKVDAAHHTKIVDWADVLKPGYKESGINGLFDIILDMIGVPEDNTVETDACSWAMEHGKWPEWGFCRDSWDHAWFEIKNGDSTMSIEEFPAWARSQLQESINQ